MAQTYCVYVASQSSPYTTPQIQIGDTFCVDCPEDGVCRGAAGQPESITIRDGQGKVASLRAALSPSTCTACPDNGHKGFQFAPKESKSGWL